VFKKCEVEANKIKLNAADKNWRYKKVNLAVETQFHRTSLSRSVALIRKMHLLITAAIHARKYTDNKRMYKKTARVWHLRSGFNSKVDVLNYKFMSLTHTGK
jgi:hypothetical protein